MTSTSSLPPPTSSGAGRTDFVSTDAVSDRPVNGMSSDDAPSFDDYCAHERSPAPDEASAEPKLDGTVDESNTNAPEAQHPDSTSSSDRTEGDDADSVDRSAFAIPVVVASALIATASPAVTSPRGDAKRGCASAENAATGPALTAATVPSASTPSASIAQPTPPAGAGTTTAAEAPPPAPIAGPAAAEVRECTTATPTPAESASSSGTTAARDKTLAVAPDAKSPRPDATNLERTNDGASANREKTAAIPVARATSMAGETEKNFLATRNEDVAKPSAAAGTGVANHMDTMKTVPISANRLDGRPGFSGGSASMGGESAGAEELSVVWKGWTNGGGERVSTAAQFSRIGDAGSSVHAPFFSAPGFSTARVPVAAAETSAPTARAFPNDQTALLAPIGAAIERLVAHGRDQLSLTVRFEQGGSLSLKLAMRDGEVATQIQTDVPGLEGALRSAWNQLAQDWQGRGMKLADPQFTGGGTTTRHDQPAQDGRSSSGREFAQGGGDTGFFARGLINPATRRAMSSSTEPAADSASTATKRAGLLTWA